jgi:hypothetical protein
VQIPSGSTNGKSMAPDSGANAASRSIQEVEA